MKSSSYKDLKIWQMGKEVAVLAYKITKSLPKEEVYGITSQIQRSAVSIPSNIAEGSKRGTKKDFLNFIRIAQGSGAELETQLEIIKDIYPNIDKKEIDFLLSKIDVLMKMLFKFSLVISEN